MVVMGLGTDKVDVEEGRTRRVVAALGVSPERKEHSATTPSIIRDLLICASLQILFTPCNLATAVRTRIEA
jgi:hypothetical protein